MSVSPSKINLLMDLKTDKVRQKKLACFIPSVFPSGSLSYNRRNTVCNYVGVFICLSINIKYHRQNIICNFVRELTITVTFAVHFFPTL